MAKPNKINTRTTSPTINPNYVKQGFSQTQYSRFSDWVLVVEGSSDRDFYSAYIKELREIYNEKAVYGQEKTKAIKNRLKYLSKKMLGAREKIICIINEKRKDGKHFYGIVDKDYQSPSFKDLLKYIQADENELNNIFEDYIKVTDANSLETMMIKYAGTTEFANILKNVQPKQTHPDFSLVTEQDICDALEFSFYIGLLRQYNEKTDGTNRGLNFKDTVKNTRFYYDFFQQSLSASTFKNQYISKLIKNSNNSNLNVNYLANTLNIQYTQNEAWDICQGHDVIDFIEAILLDKENKIHSNLNNSINKYLTGRNKNCKKRYKPTKNESAIIDAFNKYNFFYCSDIYNWLQKIDDEKKNFQSDFRNQINSFLKHPLRKHCPIIYITKFPFFIKSNNKKFFAYILFGITIDGFKEVIDIKIMEKGKIKYDNLLLLGAGLKNRGLLSIKDVYLDKYRFDENENNNFERLFSIIYPKSIFHKTDFPIQSQNPKIIFKQVYRKYKNISFNDEIDFWKSINSTILALKNDNNWNSVVKF